MTVNELIDQALGELKQTTISGVKYFAKPTAGHWKNALGYLDQAKAEAAPLPQITSPHDPPLVGDSLAVA